MSTARRRARRSGDEVMTRVDTVGAGLSQLDGMIEELSPGRPKPTPQEELKTDKQAKQGLTVYDAVTALIVLAMAALLGVVFRPPVDWATCDNSCSHPNDGSCDDGGTRSLTALCALGSDCVDCGPRAFEVPNWVVIVACLVSTALLLVGVGQTARIVRDQLAAPILMDASSFRQLRVPLTDFPFGSAMINKLANSTQCREKGMKCVQYILRGAAYTGYFSKNVRMPCLRLWSSTAACSGPPLLPALSFHCCLL